MKPEPKHVLLIDLQEEWCETSAQALRDQGFSVDSRTTYDYPPPNNSAHDLVILGCASVGKSERELMGKVLEHKEHLLVLMTKVSWPSMRSVFLAGASDVADKPYDPEFLTDIVNQTLNTIARSKA